MIHTKPNPSYTPFPSPNKGGISLKIVQPASAGKYEKDDALVEIQPAEGIEIEITCSAPTLVKKNIENEVMEALKDMGVKGAKVVVKEKGALPWVLKSRVEAAILRAGVRD
jgi:citrate lyase acyl carrier protein